MACLAGTLYDLGRYSEAERQADLSVAIARGRRLRRTQPRLSSSSQTFRASRRTRPGRRSDRRGGSSSRRDRRHRGAGVPPDGRGRGAVARGQALLGGCLSRRGDRLARAKGQCRIGRQSSRPTRGHPRFSRVRPDAGARNGVSRTGVRNRSQPRRSWGTMSSPSPPERDVRLRDSGNDRAQIRRLSSSAARHLRKMDEKR
jgi:hypothetical protein